MSGSKDEILASIGIALKKRQWDRPVQPDLVSEIYVKDDRPLKEKFKYELELVNGVCSFCDDTEDLRRKTDEYFNTNACNTIFCIDEKLKETLTGISHDLTGDPGSFKQMDAAVTPCEFIIARTGSVMVSSALSSGRRLNVFPPVHIVIAFTSQLVYDLGDAYTGMISKYGDNLPSMISLITGPSRTADIEKTLVLGAHGPKNMMVFLVND